MKNPSNKKIERYYFEKFCRCFPLPQREIVYGDRPDIIIHGDSKIGIELTRFYREDGRDINNEQFQNDIRRKVLRKAQAKYLKEGGKKIELSIGFDVNVPISDDKRLINDLVDVARRIDEMPSGEIRRDVYQSVPEVSYLYLNNKEYEDAEWKVCQSHDVPQMLTNRLDEIIKDKERKAANYERCDLYWLLVVVDFLDPAQDQEIEIPGFEKIHSEVFEKIYVYKTVFDKVLEAGGSSV